MKLRVCIATKVPRPPNFLLTVERGLVENNKIDVGELTDEDLQSVADEVRAAFVENALKRRASLSDGSPE